MKNYITIDKTKMRKAWNKTLELDKWVPTPLFIEWLLDKAKVPAEQTEYNKVMDSYIAKSAEPKGNTTQAPRNSTLPEPKVDLDWNKHYCVGCNQCRPTKLASQEGWRENKDKEGNWLCNKCGDKLEHNCEIGKQEKDDTSTDMSSKSQEECEHNWFNERVYMKCRNCGESDLSLANSEEMGKVEAVGEEWEVPEKLSRNQQIFLSNNPSMNRELIREQGNKINEILSSLEKLKLERLK
jgi:hypothetical protein